MAPPKRTDEEMAKARETGARIRKCRLARGFRTAVAPAVLAEIDPDHWRAIERGENVAYPQTMRRIARALALAPDEKSVTRMFKYLTTGKPQPKRSK